MPYADAAAGGDEQFGELAEEEEVEEVEEIEEAPEEQQDPETTDAAGGPDIVGVGSEAMDIGIDAVREPQAVSPTTEPVLGLLGVLADNQVEQQDPDTTNTPRGAGAETIDIEIDAVHQLRAVSPTTEPVLGLLDQGEQQHSETTDTAGGPDVAGASSEAMDIAMNVVDQPCAVSPTTDPVLGLLGVLADNQVEPDIPQNPAEVIEVEKEDGGDEVMATGQKDDEQAEIQTMDEGFEELIYELPVCVDLGQLAGGKLKIREGGSCSEGDPEVDKNGEKVGEPVNDLGDKAEAGVADEGDGDMDRTAGRKIEKQVATDMASGKGDQSGNEEDFWSMMGKQLEA